MIKQPKASKRSSGIVTVENKLSLNMGLINISATCDVSPITSARIGPSRKLVIDNTPITFSEISKSQKMANKHYNSNTYILKGSRNDERSRTS